MEKYIVDGIISVRDGDNGTTVIPIQADDSGSGQI
jgi:hypothetical protein